VSGYRVELAVPAIRSLERIPDRVRPAVLATIYESIAEDPYRVSKPLQRPLAAFRITRRGEYRVIFTIDEDAQVVRIHRVAHRRDAYR
jgi:mRNA interferase RelE/StbE